MREAVAGRYIGQRVRRVEDQRLLTGRGSFVADVEPEGTVHAAFVRSPFANANIVSIDHSVASRAKGVVAIYTGAEICLLTNPFIPFSNLPGQFTPPFWALAVDRVRFVGDPVAVVLAYSRALAEDAAELVEIEYQELTPVVSIDDALRTDSEPIWPAAGSNILYEAADQFGEVDEAFRKADRVFTETFTSHRLSNQPLETRGCVAEVDPESDEVVFHAATQAGHALRWTLAAVTARQSAVKSIRALAGNRGRLKAFARGAKAALAGTGDQLKKADSSGTIHQIRKDPRTLLYLGRSFLGTLSAERFPRVVAKDIGGGFGSKGPVSREDAVILAVAMELNRSVKWIEDRVENLTDGGQARDERLTISFAVQDDGTILGMKANLVMNQGAYPGVPFNCGLFSRIMKVMLPGTYRIDAFRLDTTVVASNKGRYIPYRGPWANETWARERMLDVVARELGMSATQLRLKNMYHPSELPAKMITGPTLDPTMTAATTLQRAIELAEPAAFAAKQEDARSRGRLLGIGFATYHEAAPGPPDYTDAVTPGVGALLAEKSEISLEADGTVTIRTQQMPHGQSHETTYAQVAADQLGVPMEQVRLVWGDTKNTPFGIMGTGGSRGGPIGGGAVQFSSRALRTKILDQAADLLEANVNDLEIVDGNIHVRGVPAKGKSFAEVAAAAASAGGGIGDEPAITAEFTYNGPPQGGWACATHVCWVEIDPDTGFVTIPRYLVVEDCGEMINPAIVEGQVRGGVAQGIGAVLYEKTNYDEFGNLQSSTYMDYLMPTAMEIPEIELHHLETPSEVEANYRGVGEGGAIGAPPALTNAIENALAHLGVRITEQHLPPHRILELTGVIKPNVASR